MQFHDAGADDHAPIVARKLCPAARALSPSYPSGRSGRVTSVGREATLGAMEGKKMPKDIASMKAEMMREVDTLIA